MVLGGAPRYASDPLTAIRKANPGTHR